MMWHCLRCGADFDLEKYTTACPHALPAESEEDLGELIHDVTGVLDEHDERLWLLSARMDNNHEIARMQHKMIGDLFRFIAAGAFVIVILTAWCAYLHWVVLWGAP